MMDNTSDTPITIQVIIFNIHIPPAYARRLIYFLEHVCYDWVEEGAQSLPPGTYLRLRGTLRFLVPFFFSFSSRKAV
jgi:hypothetical protein